jgi:hypothetical protein
MEVANMEKSNLSGRPCDLDRRTAFRLNAALLVLLSAHIAQASQITFTPDSFSVNTTCDGSDCTVTSPTPSESYVGNTLTFGLSSPLTLTSVNGGSSHIDLVWTGTLTGVIPGDYYDMLSDLYLADSNGVPFLLRTYFTGALIGGTPLLIRENPNPTPNLMELWDPDSVSAGSGTALTLDISVYWTPDINYTIAPGDTITIGSASQATVTLVPLTAPEPSTGVMTATLLAMALIAVPRARVRPATRR